MPQWNLQSNWREAGYRMAKASRIVRNAGLLFLKLVAGRCLEYDIVLDANQNSKKSRRQLPYTIEAVTKIVN
jgi:hypothetical protein